MRPATTAAWPAPAATAKSTLHIMGEPAALALAGRLAERVHYVELMVKRSFTDVFAQSLGFSDGNHSETPMSRKN